MKLSEIPAGGDDATATKPMRLSDVTGSAAAPEGPGIMERAVQPGIDLLKWYAGGIAAPIINFADYPARAVAADVIAAGGSPLKAGAIPTDEKSRQEFSETRDRAMKATELPTNDFGEGVSNMLALPGTLVATLASAFAKGTVGPEAAAALGPYATIVGDVLPFGGGLASAMRGPGAPKAAVQAAKAENRARSYLSERAESGAFVGGPSALDFIEQQQKARVAGQPFTLMDWENPELRQGIGTVYRQGGPGGGQIGTFLEGRKRGQVDRGEKLIESEVGAADAFKQTEAALIKTRSENAKPLFDAAAEGPGLKALEHEFTQAFNEAGRLEAEMAQRVTQAEAAVTQAAGRQSTAGNVYAASGANATERQAQAALAQARSDLSLAQQQKAAIHNMMREAQADGTWRPDATWSPYLEMLRTENPHVQGWLRSGWDIERNKAHGRGEQPNPRDYAIKGFDENGNPIVGAVPNMRLWMVVKEGLDADINGRISANHGHVDKPTYGLIQLRDGELMPDGSRVGGLLPELDRLNPRYKPARDVWSGDSNSLLALERGKNLLDTKEKGYFPTDRDVESWVNGLSPTDRELAKIGFAQTLKKEVIEAPDAADKAKRLVNSTSERRRISTLLGTDADRFLQAVEREAQMERTRMDIKGNSPTRARAAADTRNEPVLEHGASALGGVAHGLSGHVLGIPRAIASALRLRRALRDGRDLDMNEAVGRIVTDPNVAIDAQQGKPILPPITVPQRYWMTPGRSIAAGEVAMPREDDPLARAVGY